MSDYGSRFGKPAPEPEDLETILARAMRAEADRIMPAGDGLAKIRARTEGRRSVFSWFGSPAARPAMAVGALVFTLVAGTLIGLQVTGGGDGGTEIADGPSDPVIGQRFADSPLNTLMSPDPTPEEEIGDTGGELPTPNAVFTTPPPDIAFTVPVTEDQERRKTDGGVPIDNGGNYVAIQSPFSGTTIDPVFTLAGIARVFEASITIDVSQNGKVLKRTYATATEGAPELGDWQTTMQLAPGAYRIDAYALSPQDGTTKLASDSIWITVRPPAATTAPASTSSPRPSSSPTALPTSSAAPSSDVGTQQVPGTDP